MGAVDTVELEVRELVRRRGIDPFADQVQVRLLVDEVVADYDERSLTSALPQLVNVVRRPGRCTTRWPVSGRCSVTWTTQRSRRCGSTSDCLGG